MIRVNIRWFLFPMLCMMVTEASGGDSNSAGTIAFPSMELSGLDLYIHEKGEERLLIGEYANEFNASLAPDGKTIAFTRSIQGNLDLYLYSLEAETFRQLTSHPAMEDHSTWSPDGKQLAFVSTRQPNDPGRSWTGIYRIGRDGEELKRLSPDGASDYSPAWSPSGSIIAFASGSGNPGGTDIYTMQSNGSGRKKLVDNGGWPTFVEAGKAVAFHRQGSDRLWEIWKINLDGTGLEQLVSNGSMPSGNSQGTKIAFVDHKESRKRIQVLDLSSGSITTSVKSHSDCWNPTLSHDGEILVYHRATEGKRAKNVELWNAPSGFPVQLLRVTGAFPAFSPDFEWMAVTANSFSKLDLMKPDGTHRHTVYEGSRRTLFGLSWLKRPSRLAFSEGVAFSPAVSDVKLQMIDPFQPDSAVQTILQKTGNSGFPNPSPDGKKLVFRAESDGYKNLFILDKENDSTSQLTRGAWTDTMPHWSPSGEWIAFSSTRDTDYEIWIVRPDGSDLHKLIGGGGRNTHPQFSPDSQWVVFCSQRAGYSAETVSFHGMPQPYGDLFVVRVDGSQLIRLTHNAFEEGTPAWVGLKSIQPSDAMFPGIGTF